MTSDIVLSVTGIDKHFGATHANRCITLTIKRGTVHGLAGENGSGKSTLASIISGIQAPDCGVMFKDGRHYTPETPLGANRQGVAMVVQELGVIGGLTAAQNLFLGKMKQFSRFGVVNVRRLLEAAHTAFAKWELPEVPLELPASAFSIEQRKMLELARALTNDPDVLVLDEISQVLSHDNRRVLYRFIDNFKAGGKTILMVTHDLEEMLAICDEISILRDGALVSTHDAADLDADKVKRLMIGREVSGHYYRMDAKADYSPDIVLKAEDFHVPGQIERVSFELHRGEILGVCGLSDAGIHELGTALFGLAEHRTGRLTYIPANTELKSAKDVVKTHGAYLSKDRDAYGLMLDADIHSNISLPNADRLSGALGFQNPRSLRALSEQAMKDYEIKSSGLEQHTRRLSGGNKQKVNLSRWLVKDLEYIILDCPTRGVDVGVKAYIYGILMELKRKGVGIILISDELPEAMGMSDRIMVLKDHRNAAVLNREADFSEERIVEVML
ncbi:MAG: sugar ABC transporter ATP-binding protein [Clostridiales bacterium]|jgi:ribose transport system ATP-binding protein|nr:sugar ABC transporter ATP-binding protein [Clostridiales bacterium]